MKKVLAISGGVDSMVLLDRVCRGDIKTSANDVHAADLTDIVVAHFDHGTRPSSSDDAEFVRQACERYGVEFILGRAELGPDASEEEARISRYEFFASVIADLGGPRAAVLWTAHHANDLIESMAINLIRGTGWRGVAPFGNLQIFRPFLSDEMLMTKADILEYASSHEIKFRQDPTNTDERYLRNRIRHEVNNLPAESRAELVKIYHEMNNLRGEIDATVDKILPADGIYQREWFIRSGDGEAGRNDAVAGLPDNVALEILRAGLLRAGVSATRPQILDFLAAIRTYAPGKKFNLPGDRLVKFSKNTFELRDH